MSKSLNTSDITVIRPAGAGPASTGDGNGQDLVHDDNDYGTQADNRVDQPF